MRQIRENLFETNSSSTHVITIANNNDDDFKNNLPEKVYMRLGEFGWDFERYDDIDSKASYLFTAIVYNDKVDDYLMKLIKTLESWKIEVEHTPIKKIESEYTKGRFYWVNEEKPNEYFYIDHSDELDDWLKELFADETLLMNYLFSPESFVATGNDNDDEDLDDKTNAKNILMTFDKGN